MAAPPTSLSGTYSLAAGPAAGPAAGEPAQPDGARRARPVRNFRVRKRAIATSLLGLGPIPFTQTANVLSLVDEQRQIGVERPSNQLSSHEHVVREPAVRKANELIARRTEKVIKPHVQRAATVVANINVLAGLGELVPKQPLVGPRGESIGFDRALAEHDRLADEIAKEPGRHQRLGARERKGIPWLSLLDVPALVYFLGRVFNANFNRPWGTPVAAGMTAAFTLACTVIIAVGLHFLGRRHRQHKKADGHWPSVRGAGVHAAFEVALVALLIAGPALLMTIRIFIDARGAPRTGSMVAVILAGVLGIVTLAANFLIYSVAYRDGSPETERLDVYAVGLHLVRTQLQETEAQINVLTEQLDQIRATAERDAAQIRADAIRTVTGSVRDRAILYSRSVHQGCGPLAQLPPPVLDVELLERAMAQLRAQAPKPRPATSPIPGQGR
ncbi:MAG: hypothetical protein IRZ08_15505 [Frankia sp.]|nr:hypothetical protein [Frankia sp.]